VKKCCVILALVLCVSLPAGFAQSAATGDTPATREDVVKLFKVMKVHEQVRAVMDAMVKQQRTMMHDMIAKKYPDTSDEEFRRYDSVMGDFMKKFPMDAMLDDMIPVYQKHLSKTDVEAMSAFYTSPTGEKLLHDLPAMTTESMQAMAPRLQTMLDDMTKRVERMANEEHEKKESPKPQS